MNALEVLQEIIRRHQLLDARFTIVVHPAAPGWRERHPTTDERIDGVLDDDVLDDVGPSGQVRPMSGSDLVGSSLEDLAARGDGELVSISSRIETAGGIIRHLALMDLHPDQFIAHDRLMAAVDKLCRGRSFWLLRTDRHHHIYGDFIMDEAEWRSWNARFQIADVLVDGHYVGRSMHWGYNALRLNAGREYQTVVPTTIGVDAALPMTPMVSAAVRLAHRCQSTQLRRSGEPTMNHLAEVARLATAIRDACIAHGMAELEDASAEEVYACGYLHDSIEDCPADYEDVEQTAGVRVARWVSALSLDKRLPRATRYREHERQMADADAVVKVVKLADLVSNLRGIRGSEDAQWIREYLNVVEPHLDLLAPDLRWTDWYHEAREHVDRWRGRLRDRERRRSAAAVR